MPSTKQRSGAKRVRGSSRNSDKFRIGKVQGYLRGNVWYLYYHEQGQRRRPRVGPDLETARQMAAQINSQLETGAPAALSFEAISIVDLRQRWLAHHELVLRSSLASINRYRAATDHSTLALTDPEAAVSDEYHYDAWGVSTGSTGTTPNPFLYIGQQGYYYDSDLSRHHVRRREYDAELGKFFSEDPKRLKAGDANFYRYVGNDPANQTDPSGLDTIRRADQTEEKDDATGRTVTKLVPNAFWCVTPLTCTSERTYIGRYFDDNTIQLTCQPREKKLCVSVPRAESVANSHNLKNLSNNGSSDYLGGMN